VVGIYQLAGGSWVVERCEGWWGMKVFQTFLIYDVFYDSLLFITIHDLYIP